MIEIDKAACASQLRTVHPTEKLACSGALLASVLVLDAAIAAAVVVVWIGYTIARGKAPWRAFVLFLFPTVLLLIPVGLVQLLNAGIFAATEAARSTALLAALNHAVRSLSAVSVIACLALTTPAPDLFASLQRVPGLGLFVEICWLMYRFLFQFSRRLNQIQRAQVARLAPVRGMGGIRSSAQAIASLVEQSPAYVQRATLGLESRSVGAQLLLPSPCGQFSGKLLAGVGVLLLAAIVMDWLT